MTNPHCPHCDHRGLAEILPANKRAHLTLVRCPHDAGRLGEIAARVEADRDADWSPRRGFVGDQP